MNPTEELRTAAAHIRRIAIAAGGDTWQADHFPEGTIVRRAGNTRSLFRLAADGNRAAGTPYVLPATGDHMAAMGPTVGLTLADWLDSAAEDAEQIGPDPHALAVARAINGGEQR